MRGRVLVIAGSDSSGGAGIQADIKTITALGGYAATAVTAVTAQNTEGVVGIHGMPPDFVRLQMDVVLSDIGADVLKTGMLHTAGTVEAVSDFIEAKARNIPLVVDPVVVATGGAQLLEATAIKAMKDRLLLLATVMTPNVPEAEALTGMKITSLDDLEHAAEILLTLGAGAVFLTGGHLMEAEIRDVLATPDGTETFDGPRLESRHTHGTGCTLASALATGLAQGLGLRDSVLRARAYVFEAIRTAPGFGRGHGPLNHGHPLGLALKADDVL
jgi:hydroxymethylpyrimidine/phosphomethylpyrimidine kinase